MKVIDAMTGEELKLGVPVAVGDRGSVTMLQLKAGITAASALLRYQGTATVPFGPQVSVRDVWTPLVVRYLHPKYLLQWVGFVPS